MLGLSNNVAAPVAASITKRVECEKCRSTYFYHLARTSDPSGPAGSNNPRRAPAPRANETHRAALLSRLKLESEPVPCPKCGWVQSHMVRDLQRRAYGWMSRLGRAILLVAFPLIGIVLVWMAVARRGEVRETLPIFATAVLVVLAASATLFVRRHVLLRRIDPNRDYPQRSQPIPGTPPALVPAGPPDEDGALLLVCAHAVEPDIDDGWLAWRLADRFVRACCLCAGAHERAFATPVDSPRNLRVPLCARCHRSIAWRWWAWALGSIGASIALSGIVAQLVPILDDVSRAILWFGLGLSTSVGAVMTLPRALVRPYRMKVLDRHRLIVRLKFANAAYTRRLADRLRQAGPVHPRSAAA